MWAVDESWVKWRVARRVIESFYFSSRQMSVVVSCNVLQFLEIERNDFRVERDEFLLLDIIVGLVRHDGDFWRRIRCDKVAHGGQVDSYSSGSRWLCQRRCRSASSPSRRRQRGPCPSLSSDNKRAIGSRAFHRPASMAFDSLACLRSTTRTIREKSGEKKERKNRYCFSFQWRRGDVISKRTFSPHHEIFPPAVAQILCQKEQIERYRVVRLF